MASRYEVEVTVIEAKDLKNVNWRHGPLQPYAVVWIDPSYKVTTRVDGKGDENPNWNQTLIIPFNCEIKDATLYIDIVHANAAAGIKPLIGSAKLPIREIAEDAGVGSRVDRSLKLKRPSGRPQGKLKVQIAVRDPKYHAPPISHAPPYGVRDMGAHNGGGGGGAPYGAPPYAAPPPTAYATAPPMASYPYGQPAGYGQQSHVYGQPGYGYGQPGNVYGQPGYGYGQPGPVAGEKKKKSSKKLGGMGAGLGAGLAAGAVGGLVVGALGESLLEEGTKDHIEDEKSSESDDEDDDSD